MCPHCPATWAGSRAGPPVSECVSPVLTSDTFLQKLQNIQYPSKLHCRYKLYVIIQQQKKLSETGQIFGVEYRRQVEPN
jgi:hypothetical protein